MMRKVVNTLFVIFNLLVVLFLVAWGVLSYASPEGSALFGVGSTLAMFVILLPIWLAVNALLAIFRYFTSP